MIEIVPSKRYHCGRMLRVMRRDHILCLERMGVNVHRELRVAFENSSTCRTAFFDGEIAAMWGVMGSVLSPIGCVWMVLSERAMRRPLWVVKESRKQLADMIVGRHELVTTLLGDDPAAQRFAAFVGFHTGHSGPGKRAWSRQGRRVLVNHLQRDPELRLQYGNGYVVCMGWHPEESV